MAHDRAIVLIGQTAYIFFIALNLSARPARLCSAKINAYRFTLMRRGTLES